MPALIRFLIVSCCFLMGSTLLAKEVPAPPKKKILREDGKLTDYDLRVLENGPVHGPRRVFGTLLAVFPGFGVGHAVQGRYLLKGAIFTFAEAGSLALASNHDDFSLTFGALGFIGFKIWEFVDSLAGPARDNRRYELLKSEIAADDGGSFRLMPVPLVKHADSGQRSTHLGLGLTWDIP